MVDLLQELVQLEPALEGYPVHQLLGLIGEEAFGRSNGHRLVNNLLASWIASIDGSLDAMPPRPTDALSRIETRQRAARDALMRLKSGLPGVVGWWPTVVPT